MLTISFVTPSGNITSRDFKMSDIHDHWKMEDTFNAFRAVTETESIQSVTADGDELGLLLVRFVNLPYCIPRCTWFGETARFIFHNV